MTELPYGELFLNLAFLLAPSYPPTQKATGTNPWTPVGQSLWRRTMNARWVPSVALSPTLHSSGDGVAKEGTLRQVPPEYLKRPRAQARGASLG